ncbi:MAG TPA: tRNA pseudouridine(55) synthase TruB [Bacteroidales bacterium]|nr:tRNA pseudouridine(55) synthase TruB [Bacteroidales bacterium]
MQNERKNTFEEGQVLLFDKPVYWTSFDLVNKVRIMLKSTLGIKNIKVGHAGTLDPLASGLMIICTGKATKKIGEFRDLDKEYIAAIHLGETTPSFDLETETDKKYPTDHITKELVMEKLAGFIGEQKQVPPLHSAKLIKGKRAYEFARKGIQKELEPVTVNFREVGLMSFGIPETKVRIVCSKGTYVRSFARDLGLALGTGAYLSALERTAIGSFHLKNAYSLEKFQKYIEDL